MYISQNSASSFLVSSQWEAGTLSKRMKSKILIMTFDSLYRVIFTQFHSLLLCVREIFLVSTKALWIVLRFQLRHGLALPFQSYMT